MRACWSARWSCGRGCSRRSPGSAWRCACRGGASRCCATTSRKGWAPCWRRWPAKAVPSGLPRPARWALGRRLGAPTPGDPVLQVRITLAEVADPAVWRRLLVPAAIRLDRLHQVIQATMGWDNYHLHVFSDGRVNYGIPDPELAFRDERKATLHDLIPREGGRARYTYDFGDDWEHEILVEKLLVAEPGLRYPLCVAGEGACPPEDCGGAWGLRLVFGPR